MIILQCPNCRQRMNYLPLNKKNPHSKRKTCVYCGKNFKVLDNIIKQKKE